MKTALVLIDIQNDFVQGGALAVKDGDAVVGVANELMESGERVFDYVLASQDWHPPGHKSFASQHKSAKPGDLIDLGVLSQTLWPDHCVQGTKGSQFVHSLRVEHIDKVFRKGVNRDRDSYSAFFDNASLIGERESTASHLSGDTGLDKWLKQRDIKNLVFLGLATDYCVLFSVLDALKLGYQVTVVIDGCRSVEVMPGDGERALSTMKNAGARLMTALQLLTELRERKKH